MEWSKFDKQTIINTHGDMYMYRDFYFYRHANHSSRAKNLIENGEIIDILTQGHKEARNVRTPYLMINISKIICDVPAYFISGAVGSIESNHKDQVATGQASTEEETEMLEGTQDGSYNEAVDDLQQETINQIVRNSKLKRKHKQIIVQHQMDGGIVGVPVKRNGQISIQFKERNVYYPHDDDMGADLVYELDVKDEHGQDYVQVYTERQENGVLKTYNRLYTRAISGSDLEQVDDDTAKGILKMDQLEREYKGRHRPFIDYWANNPTLSTPLGTSALFGQEGKQEEINWTLTRAGITLERNGRPRISITSETWDRLEDLAKERADGVEGQGATKIDHRDLELIEMDENGNSIKLHQIDISQIGDFNHIKNIVSAMLAETNTSLEAVEMMRNGSTSSAQSGVAKFYDLLSSVIKAQHLLDEYIDFLQNLMESALWLANEDNANVIIERPDITVRDMIPVPKAERDEGTVKKRDAKAQSLRQTVRELHPNKSDAWVDEEVLEIQSESNNADTMAMSRGQQTIQGFFNNRNTDGTPLNEDGSRREE